MSSHPPVDSRESDPEVLLLATSGGVVPLAFVEEGPAIYLVATDRAALWPTEVLRAGRADYRRRSGGASATPRLVTDPAEIERILDRFRVKYGSRSVERWFSRPGRVLVLSPSSGTGDVDPEGKYYGWLESEFDLIAFDYDRHILGNRMNRLLRDRSLAQLHRIFEGRSPILEIGCGSGMETLELLKAGHEVVAIDISARMLEVVRRKARAVGAEDRLRVHRLRARDLAALVAEYGSAAFQGGFSTYGALNCEPDLAPVAAALGRLLSEGAPFLAGVYNRWCAFEILAYALTGRIGRATGRWHDPVRVGSSRFCVDVVAFSAPQMRKLFADDFRLERTEGLPVLLPPSDLARYAEMFSTRFRRLERIDRWVGTHSPGRWLGDHLLLTFRRRSPRATGSVPSISDR
ncbi:MAG: methyltransferase domain-containing protein [Thermoplasmata archaeon]